MTTELTAGQFFERLASLRSPEQVGNYQMLKSSESDEILGVRSFLLPKGLLQWTERRE
jgi:hypothetical protein